MLQHLLLEKRALKGLQREVVPVQEFAILAVCPEGEPRVSWGTGGILVDKVRGWLTGDGLVG